jgi:hypothetical protein
VNHTKRGGQIATHETDQTHPAPSEPDRWTWRTIPPPLVAETTLRLERSTSKSNLVRFVAAQPGAHASFEVIVQDFYGYHRDPRNLRTARRLAERTRDFLEAERCPLRMIISGNTVWLIVA